MKKTYSKKEYLDGEYRLNFKDGREEWIKLLRNEVMFIHKNMQKLGIVEWNFVK